MMRREIGSLARGRGLLDDVAAILNRRQSSGLARRTDNCPECQALRRTTFCCKECGYRGAPVVSGCTCIEDHRQEIDDRRTERRQLATAPAGTFTPDDFTSMVTGCERSLAVLEATTPRRCAVADAEARETNCLHGSVCCPVCSDAGDGRGAAETGKHAYRTIRDLRALLRSVGVPA